MLQNNNPLGLRELRLWLYNQNLRRLVNTVRKSAREPAGRESRSEAQTGRNRNSHCTPKHIGRDRESDKKSKPRVELFPKSRGGKRDLEEVLIPPVTRRSGTSCRFESRSKETRTN